MDPETNLREQLRLAHKICTDIDRDDAADEADANELAELVIALNAWLASGGALPSSWRRS